MTTIPPSTASRITESQIHLSDITRILRKYGLYVLGLMILGGTLSTIWAKFQTPMYDGIALIHLDQHNSISISSAGSASDEYPLKMQTQIIGLQSSMIAEETIRRLNLQKNPLFNTAPNASLDNPIQRDILVSRFLGSLSVTQVP